jgi:hypothetical protein
MYHKMDQIRRWPLKLAGLKHPPNRCRPLAIRRGCGRAGRRDGIFERLGTATVDEPAILGINTPSLKSIIG